MLERINKIARLKFPELIILLSLGSKQLEITGYERRSKFIIELIPFPNPTHNEGEVMQQIVNSVSLQTSSVQEYKHTFK